MDEAAMINEEIRRRSAEIAALKEQAGKRGIELPEFEPLVEKQEQRFALMSADRLFTEYPDKRQPVIDGLCRVGEVVNLIGAPKMGKSWFLHGMLLSVAAGRPWLGFETQPGCVLIVDNELHPEELSHRLQTVAFSMALPDDVLRNRVKTLSLRGRLVDMMQMTDLFDQLADEGLAMVGIDALYRTLPAGVSENDNAQITGLYNLLDRHAAAANVAIVLNHHTSKGDQSQKGTTDVGSGAGAISRAADSHLIMRRHEIEGCAVLEGVCRSFPGIDPLTIQWTYPTWTAKDIEPEVAVTKSRSDAKQESNDAETDRLVVQVLTSESDWTAAAKIRRKVGFGQTRIDRSLRRLLEGGQIQSQQAPNPRNKKEDIDVFRMAE